MTDHVNGNGVKVITFQPASNPTNSNLGKILYQDELGESLEIATVQKTAAGEGSYGGVESLTDNNQGDRVFKEHSPDGDVGIACNTTSCKTLSCGCFASGVEIATDKGGLSNEQVELGQPVIGYDEEKQDTVISKVVRLIKGHAQQLVQLFIKDKPIEVAEGHPIYVPAYQRYVAADSLRKGMQLLALSGALLTIDSTAIIASNVATYDFEIAEVHNYFVGEEQILVHNDNGCNIRLKKLSFDQAKRQAILGVITDPEMRKDFFKDLENTNSNINPAFKDYFLNHPNPAKAAETWKFLSNKTGKPPHSPDIRKNPANLAKLEIALDNKLWERTKNPKISYEDFKKAVNSASSKENMITKLSKASEVGDFSNAVKAGGRAIDVHAPELNNLPNLFPAGQQIPDPGGLVDAARAARKKANDDNDIPAKRKWSEELAERRADAFFQDKGYTKIELDNPPGTFPGKQRKFDRIYEAPDGTIYVIECKGGTAKLGSRMVDTPQGKKRVEQGTEQYRDDIINEIDKQLKGGLLAKKLKDAKKVQGKLKYVYFKQSVEDLVDLKDPVYKICLLYTSPSPRDATLSRMPSSA